MRPLALALVALATLSASARAQTDNYKSLPAGEGRAVMVRVCSQCHSPELAASQRLDQAGWKDLVSQMANNGAQASDAEFDQIVAYLSHAFPKQ